MNILYVQLIIIVVSSYNIITSEAMGLCAFKELKKSLKETGHPPEQKKQLCVNQLPPYCPPNTVYMNCTSNCKKSCQNPQGMIGCIDRCTEPGGCVCPGGYIWKGEYCVRFEECECFVSFEIGILAENEIYTNDDCTQRCICNSAGELTCNTGYQCSINTECDVWESKRDCYCNDGLAGDGNNCTLIDCYQALLAGYKQDGVYTIHPVNWTGLPFEVYCNMTTGGRGWTVFQRRVNGSIDFYRGWEEYKDGFGVFDQEFWLGNEKLFYLTNQKDYELRIDFMTSAWSHYYERYSLFRVDNDTMNYKLSELGDYNGTTGYDDMDYHRNMNFTTYDHDRDNDTRRNCANSRPGGWWYNACQQCNLNGYYDNVTSTRILWRHFNERQNHITYTDMKIRPVLEN